MGGARHKREERLQRAAHRKHRKDQRRKGAEDEGDFNSLRTQLEVHGLTLREVPGDGNCMFRALSDQIHGSSDQHLNMRADVVDFMRKHRDDFEPFLVDETSYDRHLQLLSENGTYGGNDSLVAFSRLHRVTIVIHQLNEPVWKVTFGDDLSGAKAAATRELHISYHNGDHYNSVRRIGDTNSRTPANIKLEQNSSTTSDASRRDMDDRMDAYRSMLQPSAGNDDNLSDYENSCSPAFANVAEPVRQVMEQTGIRDPVLAGEALEENARCVEAAVDFILHLGSLGIDQKTPEPQVNPLWREGGTGNRIFGDSAVQEAASTRPSKLEASERKRDQIKEKLQNTHLSNKKRKQLKKEQRRLAQSTNNNGKKSNGYSDDSGNEESDATVVANLESVTI